MGGVLLFWTSGHNTPHHRLSYNVMREICAYFDGRRLPIIDKNTLYMSSTEVKSYFSYKLAIKTASNPPLVLIGQTIYLFTCGVNSNLYAENCTLKMNFFGEFTHLSESPRAGLSSPASLHDTENDYIFLFGGTIKRAKTRNIEVYDRHSNHWISIKAQLLCPRSHFPAVKWLRKAYLAGGCEAGYMEAFDLDTGESLPLFQGFGFGEVREWGGLISGDSLIVGLSNWIVVFHLPTLTFRYYCEPERGWNQQLRSFWVLGEEKDPARTKPLIDSPIQKPVQQLDQPQPHQVSG